MKVVPKFQKGGGFDALFTQYIPIQREAPRQVSRSSSSKEEKESEDKGKITEKDLLELVSKVDGLPNDLNKLASDLIDTLRFQSISGVGDISDLATAYAANIVSIKTAKFNKEEYDNAYKEVVKNGGLQEYAITDSGQVIVMDKDQNITQMKVEDILRSGGDYTPLTNSNLLYLRAHSPEYANKNNIFNIVSNGIGLKEINDIIKAELSTLGSTETVRAGYSIKEGQKIQQGIQVLSEAASSEVAGMAGMTLDGLYKNKVITKDQKEQAEAALQYIYHMLPTNAKTLLKLKAGNAENPDKGARDLIGLIITSRMSATNSFESDYEGTLEQVLTKGTKGKRKGDGEDWGSDDVKSGPYYNMSRMIGFGSELKVTINKGTNYQMEINGYNYPSIADINGKPVGQTSLNTLLYSGIGGAVADQNAITFGNNVLSTEDFNNIMYNGRGGTMAILPTKITENGRKVVDLEVLDRWEAANNELKQMGIDSVLDKDRTEEIRQVLYSNNLDQYVNISTGLPDYSAFGQFLILDAYAVDKDDKFSGSQYISKIDPSDSEKKMIEQALSTDDNKYKIDSGWWSFDDIYRGSIYIPFTSNQLQALTAEGQHIKETMANEKQYEYNMLQKRLTFKRDDPSLIGSIL